MPVEFKTIRAQEGRRVLMRFDDGHEVIALLLSATEDFDGSRHLIYDAVEWANQNETYGGGPGTCYYARGETLVSIEPAGEPRAGVA